MRAGEALSNLSYRTRCHLDSSAARNELKDLVTRGLATATGATKSTAYRLADTASTSWTRADSVDRRVQVLLAIGRDSASRADIEAATGLRGQAARKWLKLLQVEGRIVLEGKPTSNRARYRALPPYVDEPPEQPEQLGLDI